MHEMRQASRKFALVVHGLLLEHVEQHQEEVQMGQSIGSS